MNINETLENLLESEMFMDYIDIDISDFISNQLFEYQIPHLYNLICVLKSKNVVIDGSDTGTGKTYTSLALCSHLNLKPLIICPKTVISTWYKISKLFNVKLLGVVNYETIRNCKYYKNNKRIKCPYISKIKNQYKWNIPRKSIVIFDEAHKCKNLKSLNSKLLLGIKNTKTLLLSATLADKPEAFHIFGYLLKFYKNLKGANNWIKSVIREDKNASRTMSTILKKIYPTNGSKMSIKELGDKFPKNQIAVQCYDINNCKDIDQKYKELNNKKELEKIIKARMDIELLKVPLMAELVNDYIQHGFSIVIFMNYIKSMKLLAKTLKTNNLLYGDIPLKDRTKLINKFQKNKINIIICIASIGGQSISLHDTNGDHPRVSLISPSYSINSLIQVLGRIYRAGTKSAVLQRIVFCANTYEEKLCENIKKKLKFMNNIDNSKTNNEIYDKLNAIIV